MKRGKRTCRKASTNIRMKKQFASGRSSIWNSLLHEIRSRTGYQWCETSWSGRGQVGYRGQIVHISHKANGRYKILEDGKTYYYTDEMFDRPKNLICKSLL